MRFILVLILAVQLFALGSLRADEESQAVAVVAQSKKSVEEAADVIEEDMLAQDDAEEIVVTARRIIKKSSSGDVEVDLSEDASVTEAVGRVIQPAAWSGTSFSIVTARDIEDSGSRSVKEALSYVSGIDMKTSGQPGAQTSVSIRGAGASQTAVLMDGVRLNNPIGSGGSGIYDISNMSASGLSRIAVLRGSQSALYGSQAMGGAVDMQVKKGSGKAQFKLAQEIGGAEHMLYRTRGSSAGSNDLMNYYIAGEWTETRGLGSSAIPAKPGGPGETDGYTHPQLISRWGITPTENMEISMIANYSYNKTSIDDGAFDDAPDPYSTDQEIFIRPKIWLSTLNNAWEHELGFAYIGSQQRSVNNATDTDTHFDSNSYQLDYKTTLKVGDWNTIVGGAEYRVDTGETYGKAWGGGTQADIEKNQVYQFDLYGQDQIRLFDDWSVTNFGGRIVNNELTDVIVVWHADTTLNIQPTGTTFKASGGSGFRAPTLYELYAPANAWSQMGNANLQPEKSIGWDLGVEQDVLAFWKRDVLRVGATYYYNYFTDKIVYHIPDPWWNPSRGFENIGRATSQGVELTATLNVTRDFTLIGGYTSLDAKNIDDASAEYGNTLPYSPWDKFYLNANLRMFDDRLDLNAGCVYNGKSYSDKANTQTKMNNEYFELNLAASYQVQKHFRVYGKLSNVLSENCSGTRGYQSPNINGYLGLEVSF